MRNKLLKAVFLVYTVSLMVACNTAQPPVVDKEQIKKEIQERENEFAAIYNSGELKNIGYYKDDAMSFPPNHAPLVGKRAIVEYLIANMDSLAQTHKISYTTKEVYVTGDGNQVLEIGYYSVVDSTGKPVNTGNYMSLFVKKDGKYSCLRDMSTSDMPIE